MNWWEKLEQDPCILENKCGRVGQEKCNRKCYVYYFSRLLYSNSNLPKLALKEYKLVPEKSDVESFNICKEYEENILEHVKKGHGIYLYSSNKGNGKTSWTFKFALEYIKQVSVKGELEGRSVYYVNISNLFEYIRINMNDKEKLQELERRIMGSHLVIFDDLGVEAPTEWVLGKLYNYINERYINGKAMIFTSNLSYAELSKRLDVRIMDRISEVCRPIEFKGVSRRRTKSWWNT